VRGEPRISPMPKGVVGNEGATEGDFKEKEEWFMKFKKLKGLTCKAPGGQ